MQIVILMTINFKTKDLNLNTVAVGYFVISDIPKFFTYSICGFSPDFWTSF